MGCENREIDFIIAVMSEQRSFHTLAVDDKSDEPVVVISQ